MRRFALSAVLLAAVLILQLTFINGLRLPGGGVPDLVLVVVAALGLTNGPAAGAIAGFAAGFCLDIAPPASGIIGEYALVLCVIGWACGRLSGTLARSAWLPIIIAAAGAVVGEVMVAALGLALQPDQVSFASVRAVLPAAVIYDLALTPFVLYLVLLITARLDEDAAAAASAGQARLRRARQGGALAGGQATGRQGLAGTQGAASGAVLLGLGGWLAGPPTSRRARRAAARHTPRLGSGRSGDGWIGSNASARLLTGGALTRRSVNTLTGRSGAARLRSGVAGSAAGGQAPRTLPGRPVNLRLAASSKREGWLRLGRPVVIGRGLSRSAVSGLGRRRSRRDGGFRPSALPGGSATAQARSRSLAASPARIDFGSGHHGTAHHPAGGPSGLSQGAVHLGARRRMFSRRRRDGVVGGGALTAVGRTGGPSAAPRFRIRSSGRGALSSATLASSATMGGGPGSPSIQAFRPARPARLRMRGRRGDGMLGGGLGSGLSPYGRSATPRFRSRPLASTRPMSGKRPRFRYRRWTLLSLITRRRTGARRQLWLIGRIGGGPK